jgi:hypothetical protein
MRDHAEWKKICEQAAHEQDPEKLIALTRRIIELLDQGVADAQHHKETGRQAADVVGNAEVGD